jgi:hypothetical protein
VENKKRVFSADVRKSKIIPLRFAKKVNNFFSKPEKEV